MSLRGVQFHLVNSVDKAQELLRWLGERPEQLGAIAFDTETTGLNPDVDRVRLVQVGDDKTGWAIPFERWGGVVEEIVARWRGRYRMHNATYDFAMMRSEGIDLPVHMIDDTRLAGHVLEPTESTALKNQASRHIDPRAASMQRELDEFMAGWTWATVPIVDVSPEELMQFKRLNPGAPHPSCYWVYGALDPVLTFQLGDVHLPRVLREAPKAYEVELGVSFVIEKMERRGAKIDRGYTEKHHTRFGEYVESVKDWCVANYGTTPGSNQGVIDALRRDGVQLTKRTKSGAISLDKDVLASVADHPLAAAVLKRRQAQKLQSTYLRRFLEYSARDGFLHPRINTVGGSGKSTGQSEGEFGVRTGRMSMDTPNLQQLPRKSADNPMAAVIRNCITARDENHTLIMSDFDQIEMRVLAHLSGDEGLRGAFGHKVDFFTKLTQEMFDDPEIAKSDPRRQTTKNAGYAKAYGAGIDKFSQTAGLSVAEGREFYNRFDRLYPGGKRFAREVEEEARRHFAEEGISYVASPLTGRRHTVDPGAEFKLVNYEIQGMSAEVFKIKLLELDAAGMGDYMILPVHDEIITDVPSESRDDAIATIRDVMNDTTLISVPLTAGIAEGFRWGQKRDIDDE